MWGSAQLSPMLYYQTKLHTITSVLYCRRKRTKKQDGVWDFLILLQHRPFIILGLGCFYSETVNIRIMMCVMLDSQQCDLIRFTVFTASCSPVRSSLGMFLVAKAWCHDALRRQYIFHNSGPNQNDSPEWNLQSLEDLFWCKPSWPRMTKQKLIL